MSQDLLPKVDRGEFQEVFIEDLNWLAPDVKQHVSVTDDEGRTLIARNVASYKGLRVWVCDERPGSAIEAELDRLIAKTSFAITVEDARYYLGGALLILSGETVSMVTTDGHRLCFARERVEGAKFKDERVLIPRKAIHELKQVTEGEETVHFSRTDNHLIFRTPRRTLTSKLVEGQFPAHEKVIAAKGPKVGVAKRVELLDALRRVSLLSTERSRAIRLTMKPDEIELHASSPDQGEAVETFAAEYSGEPVDIGFNAQYLIDFLSVLTDAEITIELKDSDAQGIFYPSSQKDGDTMHRYVLMPMRL